MKFIQRFSTEITKVTASIATISAAYTLGQHHPAPPKINHDTIDFSTLSKEQARAHLPEILNKAEIPHGDLAVPGKVHSGRYIISQWQRVASGARVIVLGKDADGDSVTVLGEQRGTLRHPQGYAESSLPTTDLTPQQLRKNNASRINGSTGKLVTADQSLKDTAVREVWEEAGIKISKEQLQMIDTNDKFSDNPIVNTVGFDFVVDLPNAPTLKSRETEFVNDDMKDPRWVKIKDIKCGDKCYAGNNPTPIDPLTMSGLSYALKHKNQPISWETREMQKQSAPQARSI